MKLFLILGLVLSALQGHASALIDLSKCSNISGVYMSEKSDEELGTMPFGADYSLININLYNEHGSGLIDYISKGQLLAGYPVQNSNNRKVQCNQNELIIFNDLSRIPESNFSKEVWKIQLDAATQKLTVTLSIYPIKPKINIREASAVLSKVSDRRSTAELIRLWLRTGQSIHNLKEELKK